MDPDAELHLVRADLERRPAGGWRRAGGERHAEAPTLGCHPPADRHHVCLRAPGLRAGTGDLLYQDRRAGSAPASSVEAVLHGDVVVHQDRLDLHTVVGGQLGRDLEVHHVAGVVLDDVDDAPTGVHSLRRRHDRVWRRRGEHLAGTGRVQHAEADEAAVERLMARSSTRDERHLARPRRLPAHDEPLFEIDPHEIGVGPLEAPEPWSRYESGSLISFFMAPLSATAFWACPDEHL